MLCICTLMWNHFIPCCILCHGRDSCTLIQIFDEETLCAVVEFIGSVGFHSSFVDESSREAEEEAEPLSSSADEAKFCGSFSVPLSFSLSSSLLAEPFPRCARDRWVCLEAASMLWRKLGTSKYFLAVLRPLINPEMQESDFFYSFSQFIPPNFPGVMSPLVRHPLFSVFFSFVPFFLLRLTLSVPGHADIVGGRSGGSVPICFAIRGLG